MGYATVGGDAATTATEVTEEAAAAASPALRNPPQLGRAPSVIEDLTPARLEKVCIVIITSLLLQTTCTHSSCVRHTPDATTASTPD